MTLADVHKEAGGGVHQGVRQDEHGVAKADGR